MDIKPFGFLLYILFIDDVVKDVNNVFYEAANLSLKQKPLRKSTSKPKQM